MKKLLFGLILTLISCSLFAKTKTTFNKANAIVDEGKTDYKIITYQQLAQEMRTGWNLGNTLEATAGYTNYSETSWGMPMTTEDMIAGLSKSGIKTIRIPISWHNHLSDKNYTINPSWMKRVKQIVDWAIKYDMYVIINIHHDNYAYNKKMNNGGGFYPTKENFDESAAFLTNIWSQISLAFNNGYDEHLIFETLNEPRLCGTNNEWNNDENSQLCKDAPDIINQFNQLIVDTIRESGGNNAVRFITCPGMQASPKSALLDSYKIPTDKKNNTGRILVSVHMYDPYNFAMESPGSKEFTNRDKSSLMDVFNHLESKFLKNGTGLIIDEYGATNKDNLEARLDWFKFFITATHKKGMVACLWDNQLTEIKNNQYSELYGFYNRNKQEWFFPEILSTIMESSK